MRHEVLERDGYRCTVPGCTMRKMLDVHHLTFRSQGGGHELTNLTTICRIHHALIHRAICTLTGTAPEGLKFERPQLFTERKPAFVAPAPIPEPPVETPLEESEDWREETVAAIFDTPPEPKPPREGLVRRDPFREWIEYQLERGREDRAHARRRALERLRRAGPRREHVFVEPDFTSGGLEWGDSRTTPPDPAAARDSTRDG